jgi:hypothetical protein
LVCLGLHRLNVRSSRLPLKSLPVCLGRALRCGKSSLGGFLRYLNSPIGSSDCALILLSLTRSNLRLVLQLCEKTTSSCQGDLHARLRTAY